MDQALGWLGDLVRWVANLFPRIAHVKATHRAVKFVRAEAREIGAGLHVWWPITTEIEVSPVVRQVLGLNQQVLETKDGQTVIADGVLVYTVVDLFKFLVENFNADDNVRELAETALREAILSLTFEEINSGRVKLDRRLTQRASEALESFGVGVESLKLQSFAKGNVLIHAGSVVRFPTGGGVTTS